MCTRSALCLPEPEMEDTPSSIIRAASSSESTGRDLNLRLTFKRCQSDLKWARCSSKVENVTPQTRQVFPSRPSADIVMLSNSPAALRTFLHHLFVACGCSHGHILRFPVPTGETHSSVRSVLAFKPFESPTRRLSKNCLSRANMFRGAMISRQRLVVQYCTQDGSAGLVNLAKTLRNEAQGTLNMYTWRRICFT